MASEYDTLIKTLRAGQKPQFPADFDTIDYARRLDAADRIGSFRDKFIIPSRASLKKKRLDGRIPGGQALCRHFPTLIHLLSASEKHDS